MVRRRYKAVEWDYDTVLEQEEYPPWLVCLSATTKMILLNVCETVNWSTRWIGEPDQATITQWRENAMSELILGTCLDDFCAAIAAAIEDCSDVQGALSVFVNSSGGTYDIGNPDEALPISERSQNLLPGDYVCDPDHRFGMAVYLVSAIHEATSDSLEKIEAATDPLELVAELADNFPALGWAAIALDVLRWMQDTAIDAYQAAYSQVIADEIACEIFCAMVVSGECDLSLQTLLDVYLDFEAPTPPPGFDVSLSEWVEWIMSLPGIIAMDIVKATSLLGLLSMGYGGAFNKYVLGHRSLATNIGLAADETNSDHSVLCDVCPALWTHTWLSTDGSVGITLEERPVSPTCLSSIVGDEIIGCTPAPVTSVGFAARIDPDERTITRVTMDVEWNKTRSGEEDTKIEVSDIRYAEKIISAQGEGSATLDTGAINEELVSDVYFEGNVRNESGSDGSYYRVTKITMWGKGTDPF